jgi:hypothetical protein
MKKILGIFLLISPLSVHSQPINPSENYPDRDLFGNYVVIRITPFCSSKAEAVSELMKFKVFCDESTYLKPYTQYLGYWQVKSVDKEKNGKWIGGYCNLRRQNKELYELDKRFLQMYCEVAEIWQFKDLIKNSNCAPEELK